MKLRLAGPEQTEALGAALARVCAGRRGLVVYLDGNLGAGKTTLARGLLRALGVQGPVRSPSYTLVEPYELEGRSLIHIDLYRLSGPEELRNLGLQDYDPAQTWWLVEWPERGAGVLPPWDLHIGLSGSGGERRVTIRPAEGAGLNLGALAAVFSDPSPPGTKEILED